jgi:hypothetical protein
MTTEISTLVNLGNLSLATADELSALEVVSNVTQYLPRIQLITKGKYVDTGKIAPGHWGVPQAGGEDIEDLGVKIDVLPLMARPKAMDVSDHDAIITVYDPNCDEFKRIMTAPKDSGCMWGPTYLVYERSTEKFYELFFCNASGRTEAAKLKAFLPNAEGVQAATLSIRYKKKPQYSWHVPVITKCTMPFDDIPSTEVFDEYIAKFREVKGGVERVEETEKPTKRAR